MKWNHGGSFAYAESFEEFQRWLAALEVLGVPYEVSKSYQRYKDTGRIVTYWRVAIKRISMYTFDEPDPQPLTPHQRD